MAGLQLFAMAALAATPIHWPEGVQWTPFDTALERAAREGKAVCVVVYADWCPKCRALAPAFAGPPIGPASKDVLMVLQNAEERPGWLQERFGDLGKYVPRVFFLRPDGTVNRELVSGHPRYPFFYTPGKKDLLAENMRRAARAAGPGTPPAPQPAAAAPPSPPPGTAPAAGAPASSDDDDPSADRGPVVLLGLLVVIGLVVALLGRKRREGG